MIRRNIGPAFLTNPVCIKYLCAPQLSFEEDLPDFRGGGGESCHSSRRALHLPGCSKFEPFNTTSSGKLAMNNGGRAATACSNCSGSHANSRSVTVTREAIQYKIFWLEFWLEKWIEIPF